MSFIAQLFHFPHINTLWQWVLNWLLMSWLFVIKFNDTGWVLFTRKVKDILSEKVLFMIRIRYLLSRTCITMRVLIYPARARNAPGRCTHFCSDARTGQSHQPGQDHSATCQMIPGILKAIFVIFILPKLPHDSPELSAVGSLFVPGAMITSQAEWPGAGSGSQHSSGWEEDDITMRHPDTWLLMSMLIQFFSISKDHTSYKIKRSPYGNNIHDYLFSAVSVWFRQTNKSAFHAIWCLLTISRFCEFVNFFMRFK